MKNLDQSKYTAVLERARKRYNQAVNAEREIRAEALIDLEFLAGEQWNAKVKGDRERGPDPRPCLVFNKVLPPVTQLGNQARQNKPAIQVNPVNSAAAKDTAKVLQGMIRHIEYDSDADQAYDTALFYAAGCGFGYWRYTCEYAGPDTFDQDIKTVTVDDPFSIYLDCFARKPDRSDAKWGFAIDKMADDTYESRYGADTADLSSEFLLELADEGWRDNDGRRVAEYWEIEYDEKTLRIAKAEDGAVRPVYLEDLDEQEIADSDWETGPDGEPLERTVEIPRVMAYLTNGYEVLEEPVQWDGSTIPIVMVTGLEMVVRGQRKIFSMTRFARDPQQLLNFYKTMEAESISLAPKAKWVGAVGQFKSKKRDWQRSNLDNAAFLEYDAVAVGDKLAPEPQWRTFDPPVQALSIGAAACIDDIKASTGYFDPSLGINKSDQSGVAIGKLQRQGDVSNFHFLDNLARALKRGGRILLELIPKKYDTAREVRIIGEDNKQKVIAVNQPYRDPETGKLYHHRLDVGKFDCAVQQGASYETQRLETREMLMALAQGNPQVWQMAADIFFQNQDFIGADILAKRFKAALPPALQDEDEDQEIPPALRAKLTQLQQAVQDLTQQNQGLTQVLQTKVLDLESRERIEARHDETRMFTAEASAKSTAMNDLAQRDHDRQLALIDKRDSLLHSGLEVMASVSADEAQRRHDQEMQQQEQAHEAQMAGADRAHQTDMAQQAPPQPPQQPPAAMPGA